MTGKKGNAKISFIHEIVWNIYWWYVIAWARCMYHAKLHYFGMKGDKKTTDRIHAFATPQQRWCGHTTIVHSFFEKKLKMCNFCITIHMNIVCISKKYNECQICTAYGNHAWKDMSFGENGNFFWTKLKKLFTKSQTLTVLFFKFKQTPKVAIETNFNSRVAHISCHFVYKSKKSHKMKGFFKITAIFHLSLTPQITFCWDLWFNPQRFVIWFRLFVITFFPLQCQTLYEIQLCCLLCFIVLHIL